MGVITSCYLWIMTAAVSYGTPPVLKQKNKNSPKSDKEVKRPERKITDQKGKLQTRSFPSYTYPTNQRLLPTFLKTPDELSWLVWVEGRCWRRRRQASQASSPFWMRGEWQAEGNFPFYIKGSSVLSCGNRDTTLIY